MQVSFYFDPSCPWSWMTSRWIVEAQKSRDINITWKPFSLEIKNAGVDVPSQYRPTMRLGLRALRVIEAAKEGNIADIESIGKFYSSIGNQIHTQKLGAKATITEALDAANWPQELHYHENSDQYDTNIKTSMDEASTLCETSDIGVPIVVLENPEPTAFFGPILTPTPKGDEAATLWDSFIVLAQNKSFYELKKHKKREADFS